MRRLASPAMIALAIAGCTPGPREPGTTVPLPPERAGESFAPESGAAQTLAIGTQPLPDWWTSFGSAKLSALVEKALRHNNDLAVAEATLRQARELAKAAAGAQGPQLDASIAAQGLKTSAVYSPPLNDPNAYRYSIQTAQLTVSYPLDVFGAGRTKVRSARAAADVAAFKAVAARTTVAANLVLAVIQRAALMEQIAATKTAIQNDRELVTLIQRRRALGDLGEADVVAQQSALATVEASLPGLERQLAHQTGLINNLLGQPVGSPSPDLPTMAELQLPATLPVGVPSDIIAHRPDVRAAEAAVRGAAADVGSAIAARLPSLTLTGSFGGAVTNIADLFTVGNPFFTAVGTVTQPIFHSKQLLHQKRAADAALDAAKAQYRSTALQAFLDVDDAIAGLRTDAVALDAAARADAAASRSLALTRRQVELGAVGTIALLNASIAAAQSSVLLVQARAARLSDTVALYQACGTKFDSNGEINK